MRLQRRVLTVLTVLGALWASVNVAGCADRGHLRGGVFENAKVRYKLDAPGDGWREVRVQQANVAWLNDGYGASMLINSHCEGVQDAPLEALAGHLVIGMTDREIVEERKFMLDKREAIEREVSARLDGVERRMMLLVLKKDGCVYDVVLDANPASFERARADYEHLKASLEVMPRKDWS
jgi:hypothetical protein